MKAFPFLMFAAAAMVVLVGVVQASGNAGLLWNYEMEVFAKRISVAEGYAQACDDKILREVVEDADRTQIEFLGQKWLDMRSRSAADKLSGAFMDCTKSNRMAIIQAVIDQGDRIIKLFEKGN